MRFRTYGLLLGLLSEAALAMPRTFESFHRQDDDANLQSIVCLITLSFLVPLSLTVDGEGYLGQQDRLCPRRAYPRLLG